VAVALGIPPSYFLKVCRFYRRHKTTEGGERGAGGGARAPRHVFAKLCVEQ
jgi:hypothetical protein